MTAHRFIVCLWEDRNIADEVGITVTGAASAEAAQVVAEALASKSNFYEGDIDPVDTFQDRWLSGSVKVSA